MGAPRETFERRWCLACLLRTGNMRCEKGKERFGGQGSIHTGQDAEEVGGESRHRQFPEVGTVCCRVRWGCSWGSGSLTRKCSWPTGCQCL